MVDGIPAYVVKNDRTGKKKVVHRASLFLWLADYGEPMRCNLIEISDVPPGNAMDQYPQEGGENGNPVPGCSLQYGLDFTMYLTVIEDPERMLSRHFIEIMKCIQFADNTTLLASHKNLIYL